MAREIKVLSGSTNTSSTVYNVPTGRTAKVTIQRLLLSNVSSGSTPTLQVGGSTVAFCTGGNSLEMGTALGVNTTISQTASGPNPRP